EPMMPIFIKVKKLSAVSSQSGIAGRFRRRGFDPASENLDDFLQLARIAVPIEESILYRTAQPISFAVICCGLSNGRVVRRTNQVNLDVPSWIVQSFNLDSVRVLPSTITLSFVPTLEP